MSESFSLDGLRATPNALYYKHHSLQEEAVPYYEGVTWEEPAVEESNPIRDAFAEDMRKA